MPILSAVAPISSSVLFLYSKLQLLLKLPYKCTLTQFLSWKLKYRQHPTLNWVVGTSLNHTADVTTCVLPLFFSDAMLSLSSILLIESMESLIIILNSFNGNFYFSNPARNNNPVRILVMQYKTLQKAQLLVGSDLFKFYLLHKMACYVNEHLSFTSWSIKIIFLISFVLWNTMMSAVLQLFLTFWAFLSMQ